MIILVLHGPNLGIIGRREPEIYGTMKLYQLNELLHRTADDYDATLRIFQSNYEGKLIDLLEDYQEMTDSLIINPGGLTHTSIALMDAVKAYSKPSVEVHLTDPQQREEFRHHSYISRVVEKTFVGNGSGSYLKAIEYLANRDKE
jgi:3-dehydroquinate dehydratase-2